jgi:alcohol dehydrogenase
LLKTKDFPTMIDKIGYRFIQKALFGISFMIPWKFPSIIKTHDSVHELTQLLLRHKVKRVLLVSDQPLVRLNILNSYIESLRNHHIQVAVYDHVVPNPTLENVEEGYRIAFDHQVEWLVAIGGGSVMDAAKAIGVRMVRKTPIKKLKGLLKVLKPIPPLVCIPTTAGTGSETTVASVLSDPQTKEKFAISDPSLFPHTAILDPTLLNTLPLPILAATGMDALTHAIESFLNLNHTKQSRTDALEAMNLIFKHLLPAYQTQSYVDKEQMLWASFLAGRSFTRAYVGYVHGLAHQLGAHYHIPHGVANAVILPHVLRAYGSSIHDKLSFLYLRFIDPNTPLSVLDQANAMIEFIESMNQTLGIPKQFKELQEEDFESIIQKAYREVHPTYPVPRFLTRNQLRTILSSI